MPLPNKPAASKAASKAQPTDIFAEVGIDVSEIGNAFLEVTHRFQPVRIVALRRPDNPEKVNPKTGEKMSIFAELDVVALDDGQERQWDVTSKRLLKQLQQFCLGKQLPVELQVKATGGKGFSRVYHVEPYNALVAAQNATADAELPCDAPTCALDYGHDGPHRTAKWVREQSASSKPTVLA